jgi:hypothetical protein
LVFVPARLGVGAGRFKVEVDARTRSLGARDCGPTQPGEQHRDEQDGYHDDDDQGES